MNNDFLVFLISDPIYSEENSLINLLALSSA